MVWFYGILSVWLVPWILYLQFTLPGHRSFIPFRAMWVVFDLVLFGVSLLTTYLLYKKSLWSGLSLTILATLLATDTWFDLMTSPPVDRLVSAVTSLSMEIPLAVFAFWCAFYIHRQIIKRSKA